METKKITERIKENYDSLTKTQRKIAGYINEHLKQIPSMSVQELAKCINTSDATIIRFAQTLGYKGYLDMRSALKEDLNEYYAPYSRFRRTTLKEHENSPCRTKTLADIVADNDMECHKEFYETFDRSLILKVAEKINEAKTVHVIGFGTDSLPATFLDWYLGVMGYNTTCYTDGGFAVSKKVSSMEKEDLVILFTMPRHLKVEKAILCTAKEIGAYTVCVTPESNLELSSLCDISLNISDQSNELINSYVTAMSLCNMMIMTIYESNKEEISGKLEKNEKLEKVFDVFL